MVGGGSESAKGGPNSLADMDRGSPNPRGIQIRCDTGIVGHAVLGNFSTVQMVIELTKICK